MLEIYTNTLKKGKPSGKQNNGVYDKGHDKNIHIKTYKHRRVRRELSRSAEFTLTK